MTDAEPTSAPAPQPLAPDEAVPLLKRLVDNLESVIEGKTGAVRQLVVALLASGSVLMEDVPGVGKTTLAKALAGSLTLTFRRVQFTPDLLPTDILGSSIYNPQDGSFTFREGPVFTNVLLADEINRASPRTQSALLEAMSEQQATIEGKQYELPAPFLVLATQNPVDYHGTYPLPEAQLDRFLLKLDLGYPDLDTELSILTRQKDHHPLSDLRPVLESDDVRSLQAGTRGVGVEESVSRYLLRIVHATRSDARLALGVSPRGSLMFFRAVQAAAYLAGRDYVTPDDVQHMAGPVLAHRLILTSKAKYSSLTKSDVVADVLASLAPPR